MCPDWLAAVGGYSETWANYVSCANWSGKTHTHMHICAYGIFIYCVQSDATLSSHLGILVRYVTTFRKSSSGTSLKAEYSGKVMIGAPSFPRPPAQKWYEALQHLPYRRGYSSRRIAREISIITARLDATPNHLSAFAAAAVKEAVSQQLIILLCISSWLTNSLCSWGQTNNRQPAPKQLQRLTDYTFNQTDTNIDSGKCMQSVRICWMRRTTGGVLALTLFGDQCPDVPILGVNAYLCDY